VNPYKAPSEKVTDTETFREVLKGAAGHEEAEFTSIPLGVLIQCCDSYCPCIFIMDDDGPCLYLDRYRPAYDDHDCICHWVPPIIMKEGGEEELEDDDYSTRPLAHPRRASTTPH
jgi:hypothetical protein